LALTFQVRITGGLGNQLFKIFNAVSISKAIQASFVLDTSWYNYPSKKGQLFSNRIFELDYFPKIRDLPRKTWGSNKSHEIVGQVFRRSPSIISNRVRYLTERNRDAFITGLISPLIVDGSFESLANLPSENTILDYLTSPSTTSVWYQQSIDIVKSERPIALHVRRGDFLNMPYLYDVVPRNYYINALSMIRDNFGSRPIHLFSDEPVNAIKFLDPSIEIEKVILQPAETQTSEVFNLLSSYPYIVGGNSTFSWWAGFLGHIRNNVDFVSMPSRFLKLEVGDPAPNLIYDGVTVIHV